MGAGVGPTGRRLRVASTVTALLTIFVACGGDDGPSAAERRAAFERWAQRADEICRGAEQDIVARGAPIDVLDVDRVAVRATADVRTAIDEIRSLRTPPGAAGRVRPVLAELDRLEQHLDALTRASRDADLEGLTDAAYLLQDDAERLHDRASAAGLRECGREEVPVAVSDAIVAPVFANHAAAFNRWFLRSVRRLTSAVPRTPRQAAAFYGRLNTFMTRARKRWDAVLPPERAEDASDAYDEALSAVQSVSGEIAAELDGGRPITRKWARAVERRYVRLDRRERKAMRRVFAATGAQPLAVPLPRRKGREPDSEVSA